MGADLIGYMCVGPKKISEAQAQAAEEKAWRIFQGLRTWWKAVETEDTNHPKPPPEISDALDSAQIDESYKLELLSFGDKDIETATKNDIDALVDEIVGFWNDPGFRDTVDRWISDTEKVIFCGEMSWGDEPSGHGYGLLKMAHVLDILDELGIR
jgi:hypothetical protein